MITREVLLQYLFLLIAAGLLLCMLSLQSAEAKAIIDLNPSSTVLGEEVTLGDVSTIQGASGPQKDILGSIVLSHAPPPARSYELRRSYIMAKMKQNLINMNVVNVRGPETIEVRADGTLMTGEKLAQLTQEYVLKETGWSEDETRFEVSKYPRDIPLPPGKLDVEIWKVSGDFYGITHFRTDIRVDERSIRSVPLVIHIQRFVPVMVPTRDLAAGEELLPGDVTVKQYDLSRESIRVRTGFCRPETPIVGKRVERYCQAGRVLTYEMLLDPPIVERGERVVIETTKGGVYVTSPGEARSSAAVGEKVPVKSLLSGKIIMARVVRPGTVTVD